MKKNRLYLSTLFSLGIIFQSSAAMQKLSLEEAQERAADQKFSLKQLQGWAEKMNAVGELLQGATVKVHAVSLQEQLQEIKKEAQELVALKEAVDSEEKYSVFLKKRDQWQKNYEYCKAQAEIRDDDARIDTESHLYLLPALRFSAVSNEDQRSVMRAYLGGYLTFEF